MCRTSNTSSLNRCFSKFFMEAFDYQDLKQLWVKSACVPSERCSGWIQVQLVENLSRRETLLQQNTQQYQYHIYCFTALSPRSKCSKAPFPLLVIVRVKDWCRWIDFMTGEEEWGRKTLLREKWRGGGEGGVRTCENQRQQQFCSWKPHLTATLESFTVSCV